MQKNRNLVLTFLQREVSRCRRAEVPGCNDDDVTLFLPPGDADSSPLLFATESQQIVGCFPNRVVGFHGARSTARGLDQFRPIAGRGRPVRSRIINSRKPAKIAAKGRPNIQNSVVGRVLPNEFRWFGR